jgi:hypothetical protein
MLFASILFNIQQIITIKKQKSQPQKEKQKEDPAEEYEIISTLFFCHENYQKTRNESYYNNHLNLELLQKIREKRYSIW